MFNFSVFFYSLICIFLVILPFKRTTSPFFLLIFLTKTSCIFLSLRIYFSRNLFYHHFTHYSFAIRFFLFLFLSIFLSIFFCHIFFGFYMICFFSFQLLLPLLLFSFLHQFYGDVSFMISCLLKFKSILIHSPIVWY